MKNRRIVKTLSTTQTIIDQVEEAIKTTDDSFSSYVNRAIQEALAKDSPKGVPNDVRISLLLQVLTNMKSLQEANDFLTQNGSSPFSEEELSTDPYTISF